MDQALVATRMQREIPYQSRHPQLIGAQHQTDNDDNEPLEGSDSGKASLERRQNFIHKFQHRMVNRDEIG
ncbi:hypothetical protein [uncultured Paenibacillus sp.]|uniref:hypothetical protein n=1 Tax=uncultured Paenibacillus sp. TaxID=227322 RepID=UPI0028D047ED|nr:hypothetical protein [uncultured Paenibacillus sp.]